MIKLLRYLLLVLILSITSSFAQSDSSTQANTKAITFSFSGFQLRGDVAGRYWVADQYSLRLGIHGRYTKSESGYPLIDSNDYNSIQTNKEIGFNISIAKYFSMYNRLAPYLGGGVGYTYEKDLNEYVYIYKTSSTITSPNNYFVSMFFGIEYWLTNNISLSGEQIISVSYAKYYREEYWQINHSTSALLLSLYF